MSTGPAAGSLYEVLAEIPDPRHRRGPVYPLAAVLTLVATAMLCGCRSLASEGGSGRDHAVAAVGAGESDRIEESLVGGGRGMPPSFGGAPFARPMRRVPTASLRIAGLSTAEHWPMSVLDQLYRLEIEFHRRFRVEVNNALEAASIHTSYALQHGYEPLLRMVGAVGPAALAEAKERMIATCDPRDVQAAYHSLRRLVAAD